MLVARVGANRLAVALEGVMITLAAFTLTLFHPGICFPVLGAKQALKYASVNRKDLDLETSVEMLPQTDTAYEPYSHRGI